MSTALRKLNFLIWVCGALALIYLGLAWILPAEVRAIRKALEKDQNVQAYYFTWYEGQTLSTRIWLRDGGYYELSYIGIEAFSEPGNVLFWQIGDLRVTCSLVTNSFAETAFNSTAGISARDFAVITNSSPDKFSLHDAFLEYNRIYDRAAQFPDAPDDVTATNERSPSGLIQSGDASVYCWKRLVDQPGLPLSAGVRMIDDGYHFYRRAER